MYLQSLDYLELVNSYDESIVERVKQVLKLDSHLTLFDYVSKELNRIKMHFFAVTERICIELDIRLCGYDKVPKELWKSVQKINIAELYEEKLRVIAHRSMYCDPIGTLKATVLLALTSKVKKDWSSLIQGIEVGSKVKLTFFDKN